MSFLFNPAGLHEAEISATETSFLVMLARGFILAIAQTLADYFVFDRVFTVHQ